MGRIIFALIACLAGSSLHGQIAFDKTDPNYNWEIATLGGTQYWTDVRVEGGWRVQRNSYFGHFRLLDDMNVRRAWGEETICNRELEESLKSGVIKPYSGKVVILLHGLCRTYKSMKPLADHLKEQGYEVILFRYASSRQQVADHARYLKRVVGELSSDVTEINFVGHSLGNIVVRHYVSDCNKSNVLNLDSRIKRMVMIGPPNQGSRMARLLKHSAGFKLIAGASGAQLSLGWENLKENLATPDFEFGIIAGGYGNAESPWSNFLLTGRDDFTVSEWETMLPGADDFLVKPLLHSTMMSQTETLNATTEFLENGYFISEGRKNPIDSLPNNPRDIEVGQ